MDLARYADGTAAAAVTQSRLNNIKPGSLGFLRFANDFIEILTQVNKNVRLLLIETKSTKGHKMAKQVFKFKTAEGKVETRKSDRPYTHVVVGRSNLAQRRAESTGAASVAQLKQDWRFYASMAAKNVGDAWGKGFTMTEKDVEKYRAYVAQYGTEENYVQARIAAMLAAINKEGEGDSSDEGVLQWSMSAVNAQKGATAAMKHYVGVRVAAV